MISRKSPKARPETLRGTGPGSGGRAWPRARGSPMGDSAGEALWTVPPLGIVVWSVVAGCFVGHCCLERVPSQSLTEGAKLYNNYNSRMADLLQPNRMSFFEDPHEFISRPA